MAKTSTLFDPGKILQWAEDGLTFLSLKLEIRVQRYTQSKKTKDIAQERSKHREIERKKRNKEIAKEQESAMDLHREFQSRKAAEKEQQFQERMEGLEQDNEGLSQETGMEL
ncbi:MAG: hypothetical protein GKR88_01565 [Flavobacteriaceae bacterium]|nr:MAG: hypothetical protein GKR88_01565 [Flavobacteriaceae bacterium]